MGEPAILTIGHSNRSLEEFTELLLENSIDLLVDVRKLAGSNKYPHFNSDPLAEHLQDRGIGYERSKELSGRRTVNREIPFEVNGWWENRSFHNYADHALTEEFERGLARLLEQGQRQRVVIMCSEAVWWRCHRRLITDHVLAHGVPVLHIMGPHQVKPAELSGGAKVDVTGSVTYPQT